jgi:hypothetical protein
MAIVLVLDENEAQSAYVEESRFAVQQTVWLYGAVVCILGQQQLLLQQ